jgi:hypothetical protein
MKTSFFTLQYGFMKKNKLFWPSLCAIGILLIGLAPIPSNAGTILKQFAPFKGVNAIIKNGNMLWLATSGGVVRYNNANGAIKTYTEMSDLPDLNLTAAVQDASGDMWFGSADGYLIKLHPQTETFTCYNALAATGWNIECLRWCSDYLLIGTSKGLSIFSILGKPIQNVKKFNLFSSVDVSAIYIFGDTIAVVSADGIAYSVIGNIQTTNFSDPGIWTTIPGQNVIGIISLSGALSPSPYKIQQFGNDSVWKFGGPNASTQLFFNDQPLNSFPSPVTCVLPLGNSGYAVGTGNSYWYLGNPSNASFNQVLINGPAAADIKSCAVDQNGMLWFLPNDLLNGIGNYDGKTWSVLTQDNTPGIGTLGTGPNQYNNSMTVTSKNDIWISTFAFGVKWYNRASASWASYQDSADPGRGALTPIARYDNVIRNDTVLTYWSLISGTCEDSLGNIWIANYKAYNDRVLHVRNARDNSAWRSFNVSDNNLRIISNYTSLVAANQNKLLNKQYIYLGYLKKEDFTGGGMSIFSYNATEDPLSPSTVVTGDPTQNLAISVTGFAVANDTLVWVAAEDGIYRVTNNRASSITKMDKITSSGLFTSIALGMDGQPVFCKDKDIYSYNDADSTLTNLTKCNAIELPVNWIHLDKNKNAFWIASKKGLYRIETGSGPLLPGKAGANIEVYPNPVSRALLKSHRINFTKLNFQDPRVRIYDAAGTLVRILTTDKNSGIITWDGANNSGRTIIPGTYFYQAKAASGTICKGKILIIP